MGMKIGISRNSLDCSGYWLVALVADNSHVCHLDVEERAPNKARVSISAITSCAKARGWLEMRISE